MIKKTNLFVIPFWKIKVINFEEKKKKLNKILEQFPENGRKGREGGIQDFDTNRQTNRFGLVEKFMSIVGEEIGAFSKELKKEPLAKVSLFSSFSGIPSNVSKA